jgi:hypothetical protein
MNNWTVNAAIESARRAQQKNEQKHDVQLEIVEGHLLECAHRNMSVEESVNGSQNNFLGFREDFTLDKWVCQDCGFEEWD